MSDDGTSSGNDGSGDPGGDPGDPGAPVDAAPDAPAGGAPADAAPDAPVDTSPTENGEMAPGEENTPAVDQMAIDAGIMNIGGEDTSPWASYEAPAMLSVDAQASLQAAYEAAVAIQDAVAAQPDDPNITEFGPRDGMFSSFNEPAYTQPDESQAIPSAPYDLMGPTPDHQDIALNPLTAFAIIYGGAAMLALGTYYGVYSIIDAITTPTPGTYPGDFPFSPSPLGPSFGIVPTPTETVPYNSQRADAEPPMQQDASHQEG